MEKLIRKICREQNFAVLATDDDGTPFTYIIAFAINADLNEIIICTPRHTSKYSCMKKNGAVSLFIDNRKNSSHDIADATGISVNGTVKEIEGTERKKTLELYLTRHPYLKDFALSDTTAVMMIAVSFYKIVNKFQQVTVYEP